MGGKNPHHKHRPHIPQQLRQYLPMTQKIFHLYRCLCKNQHMNHNTTLYLLQKEYIHIQNHIHNIAYRFLMHLACISHILKHYY